jgi:DNA-directed RNA polymerase subunit RPC12/RpoP
MKGIVLRICTQCGHIFSLEQDDPSRLPEDEPKGTKIDRDVLCPHCEYDLRSLRVGDRCPECGSEILSQDKARFLHARRMGDKWAWAPVVAVLAMLALGAIYAWVPSFRRIEPYLIVVGAIAVGYGIKGLSTGIIYLFPKGRSPLLRGVMARICSVFYIAAGVAGIVLGTLHWMGFI